MRGKAECLGVVRVEASDRGSAAIAGGSAGWSICEKGPGPLAMRRELAVWNQRQTLLSGGPNKRTAAHSQPTGPRTYGLRGKDRSRQEAGVRGVQRREHLLSLQKRLWIIQAEQAEGTDCCLQAVGLFSEKGLYPQDC